MHRSGIAQSFKMNTGVVEEKTSKLTRNFIVCQVRSDELC